jgi:hypothetical protein
MSVINESITDTECMEIKEQVLDRCPTCVYFDMQSLKNKVAKLEKKNRKLLNRKPCIVCYTLTNTKCICGTSYCGNSCQRSDWHDHKTICGELD